MKVEECPAPTTPQPMPDDEDEGWELVNADAEDDQQPEIVTSKPEPLASTECTAPAIKKEFSHAPDAAPGPSIVALVILATFASMFMILCTIMAVGMFTFLLPHPVKKSGALNFYEFDKHSEGTLRRHPKYFQSGKLDASKRVGLLEDRLQSYKENLVFRRSGGAALYSKSDVLRFGVTRMSMVAGIVKFNQMLQTKRRSANLSSYQEEFKSVRPSKDTSKSLKPHKSVKQICPPQRICLPPPSTYATIGLPVPHVQVKQSRDLLVKDCDNMTQNICNGCLEPDPAVEHILVKSEKEEPMTPLSTLENMSLVVLPSRLRLWSMKNQYKARQILSIPLAGDSQLSPFNGKYAGLDCGVLPTPSVYNRGYSLSLMQFEHSFRTSSKVQYGHILQSPIHEANITKSKHLGLLLSSSINSRFKSVNQMEQVQNLRTMMEDESNKPFDVNRALGVKRFSTMESASSISWTPTRLTEAFSPFVEKQPSAFPLVLSNMFSWPLPAKDHKHTFYETIGKQESSETPLKLMIQNGTFSVA